MVVGVTDAELRGPVILVHLAGAGGLTACAGRPFVVVAADMWPQVPRVLCSGCRLASLRDP